MWTFLKINEHNIHLPDISMFHCEAKKSIFDYPPQKFVTTGSLHPTIQFTNPDLKFFKYPNIHLKIKLFSETLNGGPHGRHQHFEKDFSKDSNSKTLLNGIYPMPPKKLLTNMVSSVGGPSWSSLDYRNAMSKNFLEKDDWIEMKRICVPPDGIVRRLYISATPADSNGNDVLGLTSGHAIYDVKHKLPFFNKELVHQLNRNISFF